MRYTPRSLTTAALVLALIAATSAACRQPGEPAPASPPAGPVEKSIHKVVVPANFDATTILNEGPSVPSPINAPTKMAIAADGRVFIAEHWGRVRIVKNDAVVPTPFLTIPDALVEHTGSRGLMGIALDPAFAANGFIYLHYTRKISASVSRNRISRFQASTANPDVAVVDGNGAPVEVLLFEMTNQSTANAHNSMPMLFGADGKLWVTTGENNFGPNAQNLQHTGGKILRLNSDGTPAPGNPLLGVPGASEIEKRLWAKGLRNPWTLARDPVTNRIFFNDVGSLEGGTPDQTNQPWEEANSVPLTTTTLLDYGWPQNEGVGANLVYRYANGPGNDGADCAIVGGAFYRSAGQTFSFPASYDGAYFFGDHCSGWIRYLPANQQAPNPATPHVPEGFATALGSALLDLQVHPDGSLYYIARKAVVRDHTAPGVIGRIRPTPVPIPTVSITAPLDGGRFTAPASLVIEASAGPSIALVEFFSNGVKLGESTAAPYQQAMNDLPQGSYRLTAKATNTQGGSKESDPVTITVNGPNAVIFTPSAGSTFVAGSAVAFSGSASDPEDGDLDPSQFEWNVILHHNSHTHPAAGPFSGASGSFIPNPDDETDPDIFYGIYLTVTDSAGLKHTARRDVFPLPVDLTLASAPVAGLKLNLDGSPQTTPKVFVSNAGVRRNLEAPYYQVGNGDFFRFLSWSHGGARAQNIFTPSAATTYTASYTPVAWTSQDIGAVATAGSFNRNGGTFTLTASGADIWSTADEFRFVYQNISGNDAVITARVASLTNTNTWTKAVVMMRNGLAAGAPNVALAVSPTATNKFRLQVRPTTGATTTSVASAANSAVPAYLRLVRAGNSFTAYSSTDNVIFTPVGTPQTVTMGETIQVGLGLTSHVDGTAPATATATFDNVQLMGSGPPAPTPPAAPTGLQATGGINQAVLAWTDNASNEDSFQIERKPAAEDDSFFLPIGTAPANATGFTDGPGLPAGDYSYRVRARNTAGDSDYTASANAMVSNLMPPLAPSDLVAADGSGQATLGWTDNASNETGFKIERKLAADDDTLFVQVATAGANVTTFIDPMLPAQTYSYRVRATNAAGDSEYSNSDDAVVTVVVAPPPPSNLGASVSGGNAVTLTWSDNAGNETGFRVEKKIGAGPFNLLATKAANSTSHTDPGVGLGNLTYRVIATGAQDSTPSNLAVVVIGNPIADATVRAGTNASTNYGTAGSLEVKLNSSVNNNRNAYVKFDLTGTAGTVTQAKLRLFGNAATAAKAIGMYQVTVSTWTETGITWNNAPAMGALIQNQTVGLTAAWIEWDVTAFVNQQKAAGATSVSLGIKTTVNAPDGQTTFNSRTGTNKPLLVISSR